MNGRCLLGSTNSTLVDRHSGLQTPHIGTVTSYDLRVMVDVLAFGRRGGSEEHALGQQPLTLAPA